MKPHNLYYFSESKKTGLQPGVRYKFRISAESSQGSVGESSIVVQTFNELEIGDIGLEVSNSILFGKNLAKIESFINKSSNQSSQYNYFILNILNSAILASKLFKSTF